MLFCLMMKKNHFKQNLILWPQVLFKDQILALDHINFLFVEEKLSKACLVNSIKDSWEGNRGNRDLEVLFPSFRIGFCRVNSSHQF